MYSNNDKKQFWTYLHIPWNTCKCTLSDVAETEPTYTVGLLVLACWLLTLKLLLLALPITFFCLQGIPGFSQNKAFSILKASLFQLLSSNEFCCIWLTCWNKYKCPETIDKVFAIHARKLYMLCKTLMQQKILNIYL